MNFLKYKIDGEERPQHQEYLEIIERLNRSERAES